MLAAHAAQAGAPTAAMGYRLQPGDLLQVVVWKETDLQTEVLIRPDGGISFPLAGDLPAAGLTTDELRKALEERVRKLIPDAVVTVSVKSPNGNQIFVIGKVNKPGDFPLLRPTDVMQALSLAGGTTPSPAPTRSACCTAMDSVRPRSGSATAMSPMAAISSRTSFCKAGIR